MRLILYILFLFNVGNSQVSLEIKNVSIASDNSGTLDIYMTNQAACSYCLNSTYNNNSQDWAQKKEACELPAPYGDTTWVSYTPITEAECAAIPSLVTTSGTSNSSLIVVAVLGSS